MISYTIAYWDFLRGVTAFEPTASAHGLDDTMADVLRRQCETFFQLNQKHKK